MFPKAKSIFHLGEEGSGVARELDRLMQPSDRLVGLRILIDDPKQEANIVTKPALKPCGASATHSACQLTPKASSDPGFLKACLMCKRELSPQNDVYMYRGDQGFCTVECRARQIMFDERKEFEASARECLGVPRRHRARKMVRELDQRKNISLAA